MKLVILLILYFFYFLRESSCINLKTSCVCDNRKEKLQSFLQVKSLCPCQEHKKTDVKLIGLLQKRVNIITSNTGDDTSQSKEKDKTQKKEISMIQLNKSKEIEANLIKSKVALLKENIY